MKKSRRIHQTHLKTCSANIKKSHFKRDKLRKKQMKMFALITWKPRKCGNFVNALDIFIGLMATLMLINSLVLIRSAKCVVFYVKCEE